MDAVSAAAMWGAANIPLTDCRTITKHLSVAFGGRVLVPEKLVTTLGSQYIVPHFGTRTLPVYGYPSKDRNGGLGCDVISGSDHGQGASRCVSKINLQSPLERKNTGNQ